MKTVTINNNTIRIDKIDIVKDVVFNASSTLKLTLPWVELTVHVMNETFTETIPIEESDWYNTECEAYMKLNVKRKMIAKAMERV